MAATHLITESQTFVHWEDYSRISQDATKPSLGLVNARVVLMSTNACFAGGGSGSANLRSGMFHNRREEPLNGYTFPTTRLLSTRIRDTLVV
jgi:hypothetical protein